MNNEILTSVINEVLEEGDADQQPWAFYAHDHGGLKGFEWTAENARQERLNFIDAVIKRYDAEVRQ